MKSFVLLRSLAHRQRFFSPYHGESEDEVVRLADGTIAYEILGYAATIEEAQHKLGIHASLMKSYPSKGSHVSIRKVTINIRASAYQCENQPIRACPWLEGPWSESDNAAFRCNLFQKELGHEIDAEGMTIYRCYDCRAAEDVK